MVVEYKKELKIPQEAFRKVPKEYIEKDFIINFFKDLPIEDLKRLINYKEIDYNNQKLWRISPKISEKLTRLQHERVVQIEASIWLDNGVEDLSLGKII